MELIDTLWNVNLQESSRAYETGEELIDTLWNVNVNESICRCLSALRINRYIMECK